MTNSPPPIKQSELKRRAILDAARAEFLTQGFRNTSMDQVAVHAGVSKRTVYNHFENKEVLFRFVAAALIAEFQTVPVEYDSQAPLNKQLSTLAEREIDAMTAPEMVAAFRALLVESFALPGIAKEIVNEVPQDQGSVQIWFSQAFADARLTPKKSVPRTGRQSTDEITIAVDQFYAILKGIFFWPCVAGYADAPTGQARKKHVKHAVEMFLTYYHAE